MKETILAFDTATAACSVALQHAGRLSVRFELAPRRHTALLLPMIDAVLAEQGITIQEVTRIVYGCGPGSFMGVRLALSVAQGLAYGVGCEVLPVSTLQILAQTVYQQQGVTEALVGWDARMDEVYWGVYALDQAGVMVAKQPDTLSPPEDIVLPIDGKALVGNAWAIYREKLPFECEKLGGRNHIDCYPDVASLMSIITPAFLAKSVSPMLAAPVYLRHNVAHVKS